MCRLSLIKRFPHHNSGILNERERMLCKTSSLVIFCMLACSLLLSRRVDTAVVRSSRRLGHLTSSLTMSADFVPIQLGLTGSIGMGKSTVASHFKSLGFPVFDADETVHELYSKGGRAVDLIEAEFPGVKQAGAIDRKILGSKVLADANALKRLEGIVHPLVKRERERFLQEKSKEGQFLVVYDIPLLFENPNQQHIDYTIVVSSPLAVQKERVLQRPGMTEEKFKSILNKQMPDEEKCGKADFIINTESSNLSPAKAQVARILESVIKENPDRWAEWKRSFAVGGSGSVRESSTESVLGRHGIEAVVFDLDDTLVPVMEPIRGAQVVLEEYMQSKFTRTREALGDDYLSMLREEMKRTAGSNLLLSHDLTAMRELALESLVHEEEQEHIEACMEEFVFKRSQVDPHLYGDVISCFEWLNSYGIKLGVLTNGNADLSKSAFGQKYLDPHLLLNSGDVGSLKPSPVGFMAICQRSRLPPGKILYIGDSFEKDTLGAASAGMKSALLKRTGGEGLRDGDDIRGHFVLDSLHPEYFEAQLLSYTWEGEKE